MIPVVDPFMAGVRPTGLQRGRGGFLRSADDAPWVTDPIAMTNHDGNKPDLIALCVERGIPVPAKVTVAQLHELLGQRPCQVKYGSPSNAGLLIEPEGGLLKHKQRYSVLGFGIDPSLIDACQQLVGMDIESEEFRRIADGVMARAERVANGMLAADRGTHGHLLCEMWDKGSNHPGRQVGASGEAVGLDMAMQVATMNAWDKMLRDNGLEILAIEASCVDDIWRLAGTLDRIVRLTRDLTFVKPGGELVTIPADTVLILDIKFGKCRKAHPIQIASYAQSVPYDTETEVRGVWPYQIDQTHGLIAHGDFGDDTRPVSIELVWVDLVAGREHGGQCVVDAKAWAGRDDVFSVAQIVEGEAGVGTRAVSGSAAPQGFDSPPAAVTPSTLSPDDCNPHGIPKPQIVEGEFAAEAKSTRTDPSTLSSAGAPVQAAPPAAGEDEATPSAPSPAVSHGNDGVVTAPQNDAITGPTVNDLLPRQGMPQHALDELEVDRLNDQRRRGYDTDGVAPGGHRNQAALQHQAPTPPMSVAGEGATTLPSPAKSWPLADPDRLALVDARNQLATEPDQGADLTDDEFAPLWAEMRAQFDALDAAARSWRGELVSEARRRNVPFHVQQVRTERTYHINKAIIALCAAEGDNDELLRALLALVVGDVALFPALHCGHVVGSLSADEATRFAALVDHFNGPGLAAYIDESGLFRLRGAA